ncbi:MAG: phosphoribosylformylglycinamidine synthase subunit PurS [Ignavibacteriae bacterium]|nr:phosphoribosylformylglycinamidine synthase subunit PurS [Ignavibacteria bacterium]MBI3364980.1 phosphoribosylformylglycinamidine synthase subunit PurS [Ignavibacteriota bacterium]
MYLARITVTLRKSILDPQGKAVHHALESLGLRSVEDVRIGKFMELRIHSPSEVEARTITDEACKKLLANPVMEDYFFSLERVST